MNKAISVYSIVFDKFYFSSVDEASNFAVANEFSIDNKQENEEVIAFIQRDMADFEINAFGSEMAFKMVRIAEGVAALVGILMEGVTKKEGYYEKPNQAAHKTYLLTKVDEAKQIVTGPVLVPDSVDLQGDFEFASDIEDAAHKFMEDARNIGEMHTKFGGIGIPVESWITRDMFFADVGNEFKIYPKGTWMMSVKITDDKVWEKVRNGELTGFSIGFRGTREVA